MPRVAPRSQQELADFESLLEMTRRGMGFVPNSMLTMGHNPQLLFSFSMLANAVLSDSRRRLSPFVMIKLLLKGVIAVARARRRAKPNRVTLELKQWVALMVSNAAGCRYCQAHTASSAARLGATPEKIAAIWEFETSPLFSDAEKAALRLAAAAGIVPNDTTDAHFEALRQHFTDSEIVEIVAVISLFGFLNRWNDTLATQLEEEPLGFATTHLDTCGWEAGKHNAA